MSTLVAHETLPTMTGMVPKVKLSQVIDQGKDAEVTLLDDATLTDLRKNYARGSTAISVHRGRGQLQAE